MFADLVGAYQSELNKRRKLHLFRGADDDFSDLTAAYKAAASYIGELADDVQGAVERMFPDPTGWQTVRPEKKLYI